MEERDVKEIVKLKVSYVTGGGMGERDAAEEGLRALIESTGKFKVEELEGQSSNPVKPKTEKEMRIREQLMERIEGYAGTLRSIKWSEMSTEDMRKLYMALKVERKEGVWGDCFKCGTELTEDMKENVDWFDVHHAGEAFPLCKKCWDEEWEAIEKEPDEAAPVCGNCGSRMRKPKVDEIAYGVADWICTVCGETIPPMEELGVESASPDSDKMKGTQKFWFATEEDAEMAGETFGKLMSGEYVFRSPVHYDKTVRGVLTRRELKYGEVVKVECLEKDVSWLLMQYFDWLWHGISVDYLLKVNKVQNKEDWVEIEWEKIERARVPKEYEIYTIQEERIDGRTWRIKGKKK